MSSAAGLIQHLVSWITFTLVLTMLPVSIYDKTLLFLFPKIQYKLFVMPERLEVSLRLALAKKLVRLPNVAGAKATIVSSRTFLLASLMKLVRSW
jgi:hypothetical protein